ncbi:PrsW family glutamic-type intramembrane protease [Peribacillus butanolivorans]|uniref:PrsW family glutamic-type intramembrane protease n=1 Tax=Peribacillus butanolivorans TaxID=421767 RepID=UPI0009F9470F|nr:PrsW family glutamic-type intramembrane protease [Peribacillus butanolivorans]
MKITASEWCNMTSQVEKVRVTLRKKLESIFHLWNVWIQNHPYILRIFTIFSWISLCALVLSLIFMEDSRKMFVQFLWSFYVILQFWFLCRSKTLTWKKYTYFFLVGAWIIVPLNSFIVSFITAIFGGMEQDVWSQAFITPIAEEVLKLIPIGVYLFLSRRASSLSLSDYALIGAATGAGFQFLEETTRRLVSGGIFDYGVTLFGGKVLHWDLFTLFPGYFEEGFLPDKMSAGHSLLTAMVTLGIGLAVRFKSKLKRSSYIFPVILLVWAIFDHSIWNASYRAPDWLTGIHDLLGSGYAAKPVFLMMLGTAVIIDYWELNRVREKILLMDGETIINPVSELWNLFRSVFEERQRFGYLLLFYRERRELGFTLLHGKTEARELLSGLEANIQKYYKALIVVFVALFTAMFLSNWGVTVNGPEACIACLFDNLQNWWDGLSAWEKGLIVLGAFALTFPLLGFWSAIGAVSTGIGIAAGGRQTADIIRNPKKLLTPETALALGISALVSRIPFGKALVKLGDSVSPRIKPYLKRILESFTGKKTTFKPGYDKHLKEVQEIVRRKGKGVVGGHNLHNFEKAFKEKGWDLKECIISRRKHPTIEGVHEIEYGLPKLDREGKIIPGELKKVSHPKTVYDPKIISDEQMLKWGEEAMKNGKIVGREKVGVASNGLKFRGFVDDSGKITNFFPTLD